MNSKTYSLIINANFSDVDRVICALGEIFGSCSEILDDISLGLFEILSNAIEHGICGYSKNEIFSSSARNLTNSDQKIHLYFINRPCPVILINYPKTIRANSTIGKGKKIIKHLTQEYYYKILGQEVWEKAVFKGAKNENHRQCS